MVDFNTRGLRFESSSGQNFIMLSLLKIVTQPRKTNLHLARASGDRFPVRAAAVLVGVAGAVRKVRSSGRGEVVWATAELGGHAAAALEVLALGRRDVVGAAAELGALAAAALVVWTLKSASQLSRTIDMGPVGPDGGIKSSLKFSIRSINSRHCI